MVVFVGVIVCLHAVGGESFLHVQRFMQSSLAGMSDTTLTPHTLSVKGVEMGLVLLRAIGPFVLTALLLGVLANLLQTGFAVSGQALVPDFTRLNPLTGLRRFLSGHGLVETIKALGKLGIIGYIACSTISNSYPQLLAAIRQDIPTILAIIGDLLYRVALRIALFLLVLAAADYAYQRWAFERSIRMTKEEVKQEFKQLEGNPQIKSRIRSRQRQIARRRMMEAVPKADVVLTNPTHFAVALQYDPVTMGAPQVVAKGADLIAERIREVARAHNVPIVENPPLARALYKSVDIGREIPAEFYAAVAEVLAFVYQINARRYATAA